MTNSPAARTRTCTLALAWVCLFMAACGESPDSHQGHKHGGGDPHHMGELPIGKVEVEGRTITVLSSGTLEPGAELKHCHLIITGEPVDEMHIWIGDATGDNVTKSPVKGLGSHPAVDLKAPPDLKDAVLGVEIQVGDQSYSATGTLQIKDAADSQ